MPLTTWSSPQAVFLKKNSPSPYDGVLAPVGYINDLERRSDLATMYKDQLDHNTDCLPELPGIAPPSAGFWEGTAVGAMVISLIWVIIKH